jgi:hypothetical protein
MRSDLRACVVSLLSSSDCRFARGSVSQAPPSLVSFEACVSSGLTQVVDQDLGKVMSWYDNESGYTNQMVREALQFSGTDSKL